MQKTSAGNQHIPITAYTEASTLSSTVDKPALVESTPPKTRQDRDSIKARKSALKAPPDLFIDRRPPHVPVRESAIASKHTRTTSSSSKWSEPVLYEEAYRVAESAARAEAPLRISFERQMQASLSRTSTLVSTAPSCGMKRPDRSSYASSKSDISLAQSLKMLRSLSENMQDPPRVQEDYENRAARNSLLSNRSSSSSVEIWAPGSQRSLTGRLRTGAAQQARLSRDSDRSFEYDPPLSPRKHTTGKEEVSPLSPVYEAPAWPLRDQPDVTKRLDSLEERNRDLEYALSQLLSVRTVDDKHQHLRDLLAKKH